MRAKEKCSECGHKGIITAKAFLGDLVADDEPYRADVSEQLSEADQNFIDTVGITTTLVISPKCHHIIWGDPFVIDD